MALTEVELNTPNLSAGGGEQDLTTVTPAGAQVYVMGLQFDDVDLGSGSTSIVRAYFGGAALLFLEETFTKDPLEFLWLPPAPSADGVQVRWTVEPGSGWSGTVTLPFYLYRV